MTFNSSPLLLGTQDAYERTALIWASQEGYLDVVMVLVAVGADLNAKDRVRSGYMGVIPDSERDACMGN